MNREHLEKSLKRFLKRKVSYTLALLITFMITGGLSFPKELAPPPVITQEEAVPENPPGWSSQFFFNFDILRSGKKKDRTSSEFKRTLDAFKNQYGSDGSDNLNRGNGTIVDTTTGSGSSEGNSSFVVRPDIKRPTEVTLSDIAVPEILVSIKKPTVNLGTLPGAVTPPESIIPTVGEITITVPDTPNEIVVTVTKSSPTEDISVSSPNVTVPTRPVDKNVEITVPTTPGFEPTTITIPQAPEAPNISLPSIPTFNSIVSSSGNSPLNLVDRSSNSNGAIDMVAITSGNFQLKKGSTPRWTYSYTGYSGKNTWSIGTAAWDDHTAIPAYNASTGAGTWSNASRTNATSTVDQLGFEKLVGRTDQSTMLSNATFLYTRNYENSNSSLGEFVHLDMHDAAPVTTQSTGLDNATTGLGNRDAILAAYNDAGNNINWSQKDVTNPSSLVANPTTSTSRRYAWINSGKIVIEGGNTSLTNHYDHFGNNGNSITYSAKGMAINTGDVIFQPYYDGTTYYQKYTSAFVVSLDANTTVNSTYLNHHIMYNGSTGSIKTYTQNASMFLSSASKDGRALSIVNRGTLGMYGMNSAGIYLKTGSQNDLQFISQDGTQFKPIVLYGDQSIGLYGGATTGATKGVFAVDIGASGIGNQNFTTADVSNSSAGTFLNNYNINNSNSNIESTFGVIANAPLSLSQHQIRIFDKTEKSVGVYPQSDIALSLGSGNISLNGGTSNVGIFVSGKGSVTSTGSISLTGGISNTAAYVKGGSSGASEIVSVPTVTVDGAVDSIVLYGENGGVIRGGTTTRTAGETGIALTMTSSVDTKDTGAAYVTGANSRINLNRTSLPSDANISITGKYLTSTTGSRYAGFGLMALNGGTIEAQNNHIQVVNGSTGAASMGSNSNIDLKGSIIDFNGSGYAVYSDGVGKINLADATLNLSGRATAFDLYTGTTTKNTIALNTNSRINVNTDGIVVFNLKNGDSGTLSLNTTGLSSTISGYLSGALGTIDVNTLVQAASTVKNYRIAAVDGGTLTIGNLDKIGTSIDTDSAKRDGYFYYNRFLGQRMNATTTSESIISALLNNNQASVFDNQVSGLEMNSSSIATSNADAQINLVNTTVNVDRLSSTVSDAGGIGLYINYGKINVDSQSTINVEKETESTSNTGNTQGVGIYGVNGSVINNAGKINAGGVQAIGILGMAYREKIGSDGEMHPVINEFGGKTGEGTIAITNTGTLDLSGATGAIGIYGDNNNTSSTASNVTISNSGTITVGAAISTSDGSGNTTYVPSIGIYGEKATISNSNGTGALGTINVGANGIGIYAKDGSTITDAGNIVLGKDAIAIMATADSTIPTGDLKVTADTSEDTNIGKTGILYKGTGLSTDSKTIDVNIDMGTASGNKFENATGIYAKNMDLTSKGDLTLGEGGTGIIGRRNLKDGKRNTVINEGTITLKDGTASGVGMFTRTVDLVNAENIILNGTNQVGMYALGKDSDGSSTTPTAVNTGTINIDGTNGTGIYVSSGATTKIDTANKIAFGNGAKGNVGIFAEASPLKVDSNLTFKNANSNGNIYLYGKETDVTFTDGVNFEVDGDSAVATTGEDKGKRTIGIYLEDTDNGTTTFDNTNSPLTVKNEAIGLYSKGATELKLNVTALGPSTDAPGQSIGVFVEGDASKNKNGATISGNVKVEGSSTLGSIGIYGDKEAKITVGDGGLTLTMDNGIGTGMYLTDGASVGGGTITINNTAVDTSGNPISNIGLYYRTSTEDPTTLANPIKATHSANLDIEGNSTIGLYVARGIQLTNTANITSANATKNNIGIYVGTGYYNQYGADLITSTGNITMNGEDDIGIYVEAGTATNEGTITLTHEGDGVGMIAQATKGENLHATVTNKGTIEAGDNLGMLISGDYQSTGVNTGTINTTGTGVYLHKAKSSFNGSGGTIDADKIGVYLKDTDGNTIGDGNLGTLTLAAGAIGVYGEGAVINFGVDTSNNEKVIGVAAKGVTPVTGDITVGVDSAGLYVMDKNVTIGDGNTGDMTTITTGANKDVTSVGIIFSKSITGEYTGLNSDVLVNAQNGVGIYLEGTDTGTSGSGIKLTHKGTVTTTGVGAYVGSGTSMTTSGSVFNVTNGGIGIYIAPNGKVDVGTTGSATFNFDDIFNNSIGVFNNGGTLSLVDSNVTVNGKGTLSLNVNGSVDSNATLTIGDGAVGLMGTYDSVLNTAAHLTNTGNITAQNGGIGIGAVVRKNTDGTPGTTPIETVTINNTGTITSTGISSGGSQSLGIYTNVADVNNTGTINVGDNAIGIYSNYVNGKVLNVTNNNLILTGSNGIGVYLNGELANGTASQDKINLVSNTITSNGSGNTGLVLDGLSGSINAGSIALNNQGKGVLVTGDGTVALTGSIEVGDSSVDPVTGEIKETSIGVLAKDKTLLDGTTIKYPDVTLAEGIKITAGKGGIGAYAEGENTKLTVENMADITVGEDGVYLYNKGATVNTKSSFTADNRIGIATEGGIVDLRGNTLTAINGGVGLYIKNTLPKLQNAANLMAGAGTSNDSSIGVYYDNITENIENIVSVTQVGDYNIGVVLDKSTGTYTGNLLLGDDGNYQKGIVAQNGSSLTMAGNIVLAGGNNNVGIYGNSSSLNLTGDISVNTNISSSTSIGAYVDGGSYQGTGNIDLGAYGVGVYGKNIADGSTISQTGTTMKVGANGLGIYGAGAGAGHIQVAMTDGITLGAGAIGVYGNNLNSTVTGDVKVGTDKAIGIVSTGYGDVSYTGTMDIADKASSESIGIYKLNGSGIITTSKGVTRAGSSPWSVGNYGYGIYVKQKNGGMALIDNNVDMNLGIGAIGIYSSGANTVVNTGNISVGESYVDANHNDFSKQINSVGMYLLGGTVATNSGTIDVTKAHSVGVYGSGEGTKFTNEKDGIIKVNNSATGIMVKDKAYALNLGTIDIGGDMDSCKIENVGMAAYTGATIENRGTINVSSGTGMVIDKDSKLINGGTINVTGTGKKTNQEGGSQDGQTQDVTVGSVNISADGDITIGSNYVGIGGTLTTDGNLIVNGAYVDVTTGTPVFEAGNISGSIHLLPNFALTGNGISYEFKNFVSTALADVNAGSVNAVTSPLFVSNITEDGDLIIAKRPYADITVGDQFDNLHNGLDNILANSGGEGKDADILKGLNAYLEGLSDDEFADETARTLSETRGDIYATIQERMQDINRTFDSSFYEMESSKNLGRNNNKYSVLYRNGDYRDRTVGIDDYDYNIAGLLYMYERDRDTSGNKYGITLGFAGSKFDFKDGGSEENVYSLRAGAHLSKNLSDIYRINWLSRVDLGYNRHNADRKLNLHRDYEDHGDYNSMSVAFDNRISKPLYKENGRELDIYSDFNMEYGRFFGFKEHSGDDGGLEVQVKSDDYWSAKLGLGLAGFQNLWTGNTGALKLIADVKYDYDFGDNYSGNQARLVNGEEGYYDLITPEKVRGRFVGKLGLALEKTDHYGVTLEAEVQDEGNRRDTTMTYSVRFNYKM